MTGEHFQGTPVISVIIATMNCDDCLSCALDSIRKQRGVDFECIVVDGGSTDGTVDVIKANTDIITYWVSEADEGIADAFNKGIRVSTGLLVYFMGADDVLHDKWVFADITRELPMLQRPYFFYGDLFYSYSKRKKRISQNYSMGKFRKYNCLPHQAMFLERNFFDKYGLFDNQYKYAMDYEHISRFIDSHEPQYLNRIIAEMKRYGKSSDVLPAHAEMDKVRFSRGYASSKRIALDRLVLRLKMLIARLFYLDW